MSFQPGQEPAAPKRSSRLKVKLIVAAVVALALIAFVGSNTQRVEVSYLTIDGRAPLWVVLAVTAVAGGIIGQVVEMFLRRSFGRDRNGRREKA